MTMGRYPFHGLQRKRIFWIWAAPARGHLEAWYKHVEQEVQWIF